MTTDQRQWLDGELMMRRRTQAEQGAANASDRLIEHLSHAAGRELAAATEPRGDPKGGRPAKNLTPHKVSSPLSSAGLVARMKRDRPDVLAAYERGEYRSIKAAAIVAGIVKPRWSAPEDVAALAAAIRRRYTLAERRALLQTLELEEFWRPRND